MRKKVIVYGLGNLYNQYRKIIEKKYDIIGVCDKDEEKIAGFSLGMTRAEMVDNIKHYDAILVMPYDFAIVDELVDVLKIELDKIIYFCGTPEYRTYGENEPMISFYGQWGEDAILDLIFSKIELPIERLRYLELGVFDPMEISNTYYFSIRGAEGVLIDANPEIERKCKCVRPRDVFYHYAVGSESKTEKVQFHIAEMRALSSLSKNVIEEHIEGAVVEKSIEVNLIGINDLLGKIGYIPDFVSIDIEGMDWEVIKAWDFEKYRPKVIVVELKGNELVSFMKSKGYIWYTTQKSNSFFIEKEFNDRL